MTDPSNSTFEGSSEGGKAPAHDGDASPQTLATNSRIHTGASSGFALPSSKPFTGTLGQINPFSTAGSLSSTPEVTPLGTPAAELQKLNLGVERYARAIEDSELIGSFSGTVPLPSLSQTHHIAQRRPSNALIEPLSSSEAGATSKALDTIRDSEVDGPGHGLSLTLLKRAITGRLRQQDGNPDDLESNIMPTLEASMYVGTPENKGWNEKDTDRKRQTEKDDKTQDTKESKENEEGMRRRKLKGGILSHLLKLQRNEAAAAAATSGSASSQARRSPSVKNTSVKNTRKGFYYRSASRNNSMTSLKNMTAPSVSTTPRVSPRNSAFFDRDTGLADTRTFQDELCKDTDNRNIHRDIAEILMRQSFLIMMAKALILYGTPSHRIEETCGLLARKMDVDASFALLPGLMTISFNDPETHTSDTRHLHCSQGMDMHKLASVHKIALEVLRGGSIEKANRELEQVALEPAIFPLWLTLLGWLGSSAFVAPLAFNGGWLDMCVAGFCGLLVGILGIVAAKFPVYGNVFEITSSILVGFIAKAFGDRVCFSAVALAGVVVLLPGLLLTQAIMELASRNVVSGAVRMFYALMYAFFLGFGLTLGAEIWDYITGGPIAASPTACQHAINRWWYFLIYPAVSASINIVFNANLRQWFGMTLVTSVGLVFTLFLKSGPQITAAIAAFAVGITGQLYGRLTGQLSYVPLLSGVLLLVPGSVGVRGILAIIGSDPSQGFTFVLTMIHVSVAITLGVFCSALVWYPFWRKSTFMNF
ncbi:hypothetical protein BGZ50_003129 [Haplosporangium sp. Z 11]|nr:hypothetical protein BGZ50_003129 [Haplosporangium sp. Z 11]